jgi:hypothetical protein
MPGAGNSPERIDEDQILLQTGCKPDILQVNASGGQIRASLGQPKRAPDLRHFPGSADVEVGVKLSGAFPDQTGEQGGDNPGFPDLPGQ